VKEAPKKMLFSEVKGGEKRMTKYYLRVARYFLTTTVLTGFASYN
jgi:hypothetical protein